MLPEVGAVDLDVEGVWVYLPDLHKTLHKGKSRWVPLGPQARDVLAPYLDRGPDLPCFSPKESKAAGIAARAAARQTPRYPSHQKRNQAKRLDAPKRAPGDRYTRQSYLTAVQRACDKAQVARWSPYQLRHARGTEVDEKLGLDAARHALGHDSAQTTTRYAKVSFKTAAKVARELG